MKLISVAAVMAVAINLSGCAVTPVDPAAKNVRIVSERDAKGCKFIDHVSANNHNTLSGNPEEDARNQAINRVAALGGNALRVLSTNSQIAPSGVGSIFSLSGEAYLCK